MAKTFGLGKGLAALQAEMGAVPNISILTGAERVVVKQIPLAQIGANPDQPRKTFTDAELADLAASIKEKGVLQPILLRAVAGRPHLYEIVAGERRYRASRLAGLTEIPALVKTLSDANAMEIALIENVQRENLNPMEEAAAYKNLMETCGYALADVSRLIGKSESYIRNMMRIMGLPDAVREMVRAGELSATHARAIVVADDPLALARAVVDEHLSVAETERRVKTVARSTKSRQTPVKTTMDDGARRDMETRLKSALGTDVKIVERRGGAGQVVLSFKTRVQLTQLIEKLTK